MMEKSATINDPSRDGRDENNPDNRKKPAQHGPVPSGVKRFTYATGARPLEGFTIKRGIGAGGFGEVYYAVSDAGKEVALKHIQRNLDVELRGVGQCLNLKHPNLLALYDIRYDEAGEGWVVMEYITGESLAHVVERNPNGMPHDQIAFWLSGIAAGTACLHDHGIVHRDLKPGNIFNDNGLIKVGDYGLSKFISVSRRSAQTESVGTFHYMAPEIGKGRYGREIDVYALGVILFEMLTGEVPFDGESSQEIIMKHLTAEPDLGKVPQPYRSAIDRALEKDPEKRLSSIPEMLAMLNLAVPALGSTAPIALAPQTPAHVASGLAGDEDSIDDDIVDAELHEDTNLDQNEYKLRPDSASGASATEDDTLYIDDTPEPPTKSNSEIEFGPVEHRPSHHSHGYTRPYGQVARNVPRARTSSRAAESRPLPDEPIARTLAVGWRGVMSWFNNPHISSPLKAIVLIAVLGCGIPLLVLNYWVLAVLMGLGLLYGVYYAVRAIVLTTMRDDEQDQDEAALGRVARWQQHARAEIVSRPWAQRMSELTGGLLLSAAVAGVLSVVIMILAGESMAGSVHTWAPQLAWLAIASIGGSWAVLLMTKLWEGRTGDQILRRIAMLAVGLVLGAIAYAVDASLFVDVGFGNLRNSHELWASWHDGDQPSLVAYLAYFGGLFAILRWWLQADPLRKSRLSFWAIVLSGFWGFIIPFPQPWGMMMAIAISVAVQLSAPWMSTKERTRLRQQFRLQDART